MDAKSLDEALLSYSQLAASPGVSNLRLWREVKVQLVITATAKETP